MLFKTRHLILFNLQTELVIFQAYNYNGTKCFGKKCWCHKCGPLIHGFHTLLKVSAGFRGNMAEWLERWTCNTEALSSGPALAGFVPEFKSLAMLVKYLTGLPPTSWNFNFVMFSLNYLIHCP